MKGMKTFTVTSSIATLILLLMTATASTVAAEFEHSYAFSGRDRLTNGDLVSISGGGTFSETGSATGTYVFVLNIGQAMAWTCEVSSVTTSPPFTTVTLFGTVAAFTPNSIYIGNGACGPLIITEGATVTTGTISLDESGGGGLFSDLSVAGVSFVFDPTPTSPVIIS